METKTVHIIIVTYNEYGYTEDCLRSVLASAYQDIRVWLVENGSEGNQYMDFKKKWEGIDKIILLEAERNLGFGGGCNVALEKIRDGYVVFLNNDTVVEPGWLESMVNYMEANADVGACQPKILNQKQTGYFEYAGAAGGFMDVYGYPFTRGRIFFDVEKDQGQYDDIVDVAWCSGTCMMTRRSVLDRVGVFDEIFFMYGEEADLCWRINHAGYRLMCIPNARIFHVGGATMAKRASYKKIFYLHRNGLILLLKNYTVAEWLRFVSVRVLLDMVAFGYYLTIRPHRLSWFALLSAYTHLIILLPRVIKTHFVIRAARLNSPVRLPPLYRRSIVLDYFLRHKKTFSDLDKRLIR